MLWFVQRPRMWVLLELLVTPGTVPYRPLVPVIGTWGRSC